MKKEGIVDPTKVTRSAIQNASSVASMILTTESLVTEKKEPKECGCGGHEDAPWAECIKNKTMELKGSLNFVFKN